MGSRRTTRCGDGVGAGLKAASAEAPIDPILQVAGVARDPEALTSRILQAWEKGRVPLPKGFRARVTRTHYKPFTRARLLGEASGFGPGAGRDRRFFFLGLFNSSGGTRARHEATSSKALFPSHGPAALLLEDWRAVLWWLPNGPWLRCAGCFTDEREFAEFLANRGLTDLGLGPGAPELIRFVPRKRALFRCGTAESPKLFIKCYPKGAAELATLNLRRLAGAEGPLEFEFPRIVFRDTRAQALGTSAVAGVPLATLFEHAEGVFERLGRGLASLHRSRITPLSTWSVEGELASVRRAMSDLELALPSLGAELRPLLHALEAALPAPDASPRAPIHGNLGADQILVARDSVGIVGWDDLCLGDPLYDVARLTAHYLYRARAFSLSSAVQGRALGALFEAYAKASGHRLDRERLRWHVAASLVIRARISGLRTLDEGWKDDVVEAISLANGVLDTRVR